MAHIRILGTGGTIASTSATTGGAVAAESAATLTNSSHTQHQTSTTELLTLGSYQLTLGDLREICRGIHEAAQDPTVDGIVVTHGTDTIEETAFLADLCHNDRVPVIFTGAQRTADSISPDGPVNLAQAIEFAALPELAAAGALIAFGGVARTARGARKAHTIAPDPFLGGIEVAYLDGEQVNTNALPHRSRSIALPSAALNDRQVALIPVAPGIDPTLFRTALHGGAEAIVLMGTGIGNAGTGFTDAIRDAVRAQVPVILATRVPWGPVVPVYGNGGGVDLTAAGALPAGRLNPYQARILAAALLDNNPDPSTFAARFTAYLQSDQLPQG